jgi:hypothetical protein
MWVVEGGSSDAGRWQQSPMPREGMPIRSRRPLLRMRADGNSALNRVTPIHAWAVGACVAFVSSKEDGPSEWLVALFRKQSGDDSSVYF